ncbi:MAG: class I SAM-dependent methyltransferase [Rhodospirillaceae bacterium]|nr:class I SAM-dependent methyltransferase [Rhodospirillaceae bacterium]
MDRRTLMGATAAVSAAVGSLFTGRKAQAKAKDTMPYPKGTLQPRGHIERLERLPTVDLESRQDFLMSFRTWVNTELSRAGQARAEEIVKEKGLAGKDLTQQDAIALLQDDPVISMSTRAWLSAQQLMWNGLREEFEGNADKYLAEMEAADKMGPGTLELNPNAKWPDYVKHEIHIQPGGYVGSEFAGHMYHYGTNAFYTGRNFNDELHVGSAARMPVPKDGKVKRILDIGCGIGQLALALKERFPDAEVWAIDVGGPMIRYGHLRAVERGLAVNFAQRLGEDTKFPDNYFDIVTSYIMFHEVNPEGTAAQVKEAMRIVRPGGIYYPLDFKLTGAPRRTAYGLYRGWMDHRWNNEVWTQKFRANGLPDMIRKAGFELNEKEPELLRGFGVLNATKPA